MTIRVLSISLAAFALTACDGRGEDTANPTDDSEVADDSEVTDDSNVVETGWGVSGVGWDLMNSAPVAGGLCVTIADPTDAASSGDPADLIVLSTTTTAEDGTFTATGIETSSLIGVFMIISDCADEGTVRATGTGIAPASYDELGDGDLLEGATAISVNATFEAALDQSATLAGYAGAPIATAGLMMGFVQDSAGTAIDGATVTGPTSTFYMDVDSSDGLFTTGAEVNASTDALTGALFVVPGAPIYTYKADADGEVFQSQLFGAVPGLVTVMKFIAD